MNKTIRPGAARCQGLFFTRKSLARKRLYGVRFNLMKKYSTIRVELPPEEDNVLDTLQRKLRDHLKVDFVSKASTIRFLIRNGTIPTTEQ